MDKAQLRAEIKERKKQFDSNELYMMSIEVVGRLLDDDHFFTAENVLLYSSLPDEVDTTDLIETLIESGVNVYLPKVTSDEDMEIRLCKNMNELQPGPFGILEPTGPVISDLSIIDVAIIPGVAFDHKGNRLGRGKGYYDRLLANKQMKDVYKIGICFDFQLVDEIPVTENDKKMNSVI
jgi:5-formyltetrahydrofolate cyclo-ligase